MLNTHEHMQYTQLVCRVPRVLTRDMNKREFRLKIWKQLVQLHKSTYIFSFIFTIVDAP